MANLLNFEIEKIFEYKDITIKSQILNFFKNKYAADAKNENEILLFTYSKLKFLIEENELSYSLESLVLYRTLLYIGNYDKIYYYYYAELIYKLINKTLENKDLNYLILFLIDKNKNLFKSIDYKKIESSENRFIYNNEYFFNNLIICIYDDINKKIYYSTDEEKIDEDIKNVIISNIQKNDFIAFQYKNLIFFKLSTIYHFYFFGIKDNLVDFIEKNNIKFEEINYTQYGLDITKINLLPQFYLSQIFIHELQHYAFYLYGIVEKINELNEIDRKYFNYFSNKIINEIKLKKYEIFGRNELEYLNEILSYILSSTKIVLYLREFQFEINYLISSVLNKEYTEFYLNLLELTKTINKDYKFFLFNFKHNVIYNDFIKFDFKLSYNPKDFRYKKVKFVEGDYEELKFDEEIISFKQMLYPDKERKLNNYNLNISGENIEKDIMLVESFVFCNSNMYKFLLREDFDFNKEIYNWLSNSIYLTINKNLYSERTIKSPIVVFYENKIHYFPKLFNKNVTNIVDNFPVYFEVYLYIAENILTKNYFFDRKQIYSEEFIEALKINYEIYKNFIEEIKKPIIDFKKALPYHLRLQELLTDKEWAEKYNSLETEKEKYELFIKYRELKEKNIPVFAINNKMLLRYYLNFKVYDAEGVLHEIKNFYSDVQEKLNISEYEDKIIYKFINCALSNFNFYNQSYYTDSLSRAINDLIYESREIDKKDKEMEAEKLKASNNSLDYVNLLFNEFLRQLPDEVKEDLSINYNKFLLKSVVGDYDKIPIAFSHNLYFKKNTDGKKRYLVLNQAQTRGIRKIILNDSFYIAHEVGVGKTIEAIASLIMAIELYNLKNISIIVPVKVYNKWKRELIGEYIQIKDKKSVKKVFKEYGLLSGVSNINVNLYSNFNEQIQDSLTYLDSNIVEKIKKSKLTYEIITYLFKKIYSKKYDSHAFTLNKNLNINELQKINIYDLFSQKDFKDDLEKEYGNILEKEFDIKLSENITYEDFITKLLKNNTEPLFKLGQYSEIDYFKFIKYVITTILEHLNDKMLNYNTVHLNAKSRNFKDYREFLNTLSEKTGLENDLILEACQFFVYLFFISSKDAYDDYVMNVDKKFNLEKNNHKDIILSKFTITYSYSHIFSSFIQSILNYNKHFFYSYLELKIINYCLDNHDKYLKVENSKLKLKNGVNINLFKSTVFENVSFSTKEIKNLIKLYYSNLKSSGTLTKILDLYYKNLINPKFNFDKFNTELLIVDEAHYYVKSLNSANSFLYQKPETIDLKNKENTIYNYLHNSLSQNISTRALKFYILQRLYQQTCNLKNVPLRIILLSGTPFKNSPLEICSAIGMSDIDFINTYGFNNLLEFSMLFFDVRYTEIVKANMQIESEINIQNLLNSTVLNQIINCNIDILSADNIITRPEKIILPNEKSYETVLYTTNGNVNITVPPIQTNLKPTLLQHAISEGILDLLNEFYNKKNSKINKKFEEIYNNSLTKDKRFEEIFYEYKKIYDNNILTDEERLELLQGFNLIKTTISNAIKYFYICKKLNISYTYYYELLNHAENYYSENYYLVPTMAKDLLIKLQRYLFITSIYMTRLNSISPMLLTIIGNILNIKNLLNSKDSASENFNEEDAEILNSIYYQFISGLSILNKYEIKLFNNKYYDNIDDFNLNNLNVFITTSSKLKYVIDCIKGIYKNKKELKGIVIYTNLALSEDKEIITKSIAEILKLYILENKIVDDKIFDYEDVVVNSENIEVKKTFKLNRVEILTGQTQEEKRIAIIDAFNDGEINIIITSIKEAVDLNKHTIILFNISVDWNLSDNIQIEGRVHRQGNENSAVVIAYPVVINSGDVIMWQKLIDKRKRFANININKLEDSVKIIKEDLNEKLEDDNYLLNMISDIKMISKFLFKNEVSSKFVEYISINEKLNKLIDYSNKYSGNYMNYINGLKSIYTYNNIITNYNDVISLKLNLLIEDLKKINEKIKNDDFELIKVKNKIISELHKIKHELIENKLISISSFDLYEKLNEFKNNILTIQKEIIEFFEDVENFEQMLFNKVDIFVLFEEDDDEKIIIKFKKQLEESQNQMFKNYDLILAYSNILKELIEKYNKIYEKLNVLNQDFIFKKVLSIDVNSLNKKQILSFIKNYDFEFDINNRINNIDFEKFTDFCNLYIEAHVTKNKIQSIKNSINNINLEINKLNNELNLVLKTYKNVSQNKESLTVEESKVKDEEVNLLINFEVEASPISIKKQLEDKIKNIEVLIENNVLKKKEKEILLEKEIEKLKNIQKALKDEYNYNIDTIYSGAKKGESIDKYINLRSKIDEVNSIITEYISINNSINSNKELIKNKNEQIKSFLINLLDNFFYSSHLKTEVHSPNSLEEVNTIMTPVITYKNVVKTQFINFFLGNRYDLSSYENLKPINKKDTFIYDLLISRGFLEIYLNLILKNKDLLINTKYELKNELENEFVEFYNILLNKFKEIITEDSNINIFSNEKNYSSYAYEILNKENIIENYKSKGFLFKSMIDIFIYGYIPNSNSLNELLSKIENSYENYLDIIFYDKKELLNLLNIDLKIILECYFKFLNSKNLNDLINEFNKKKENIVNNYPYLKNISINSSLTNALENAIENINEDIVYHFTKKSFDIIKNNVSLNYTINEVSKDLINFIDSIYDYKMKDIVYFYNENLDLDESDKKTEIIKGETIGIKNDNFKKEEIEVEQNYETISTDEIKETHEIDSKILDYLELYKSILDIFDNLKIDLENEPKYIKKAYYLLKSEFSLHNIYIKNQNLILKKFDDLIISLNFVKDNLKIYFEKYLNKQN